MLLLERNPAVAIQFLRAAQRDFPVLDDYIRLWIGEALLNLGDAKEAADHIRKHSAGGAGLQFLDKGRVSSRGSVVSGFELS